MKRKVKKESSVPHKKQRSDGNQSQFEGGKEGKSSPSDSFNVKLFRKKLNENDFISGK